MKKAIVVLFAGILLFGCSSNESGEQEETSEVEEETEEEEEVEVTENKNDDLKDFVEYTVISNEINLDVYQGNVETDNQGNRIILFENEEGEKEYKSIFIKNDNRLKIIKLDDDGQIFNDIINE